jgi:hypothetical protein
MTAVKDVDNGEAKILSTVSKPTVKNGAVVTKWFQGQHSLSRG